MKKILLTIKILLCIQIVYGQTNLTLKDSIGIYFKETREATKKAEKLWNLDLYGPILIVNPYTRQTYSNFQDTLGVLKKEGEIYSGILPNSILLANYTLNWGGLKWAMVLTIFIKDNKEDRVELFSHELFHKAQPLLNFPRKYDLRNAQLDRMEGRIYLRLEMEALIKALKSTDKNESYRHLLNALFFRQYRYKLYPEAYASEASLEINEGLASYTGKVIRGIKNKDVGVFMEDIIRKFMKEPSYVRLFAYQTIPSYGFLLRNKDKYWNRKLNSEVNLTDFFISEFNLKEKLSHTINIDSLANFYGFNSIRSEETERNEKNKKIVELYKSKFINQPHFEIIFENKSISYDTRYIVTIDDLGFVYSTIKAIDNWGILEIKEVGGLMSKNLDKITITPPLKTEGNNIRGEGWSLKINDGYTIFKDNISGNYKLIAK